MGLGTLGGLGNLDLGQLQGYLQGVTPLGRPCDEGGLLSLYFGFMFSS